MALPPPMASSGWPVLGASSGLPFEEEQYDLRRKYDVHRAGAQRLGDARAMLSTSGRPTC